VTATGSTTNYLDTIESGSVTLPGPFDASPHRDPKSDFYYPDEPDETVNPDETDHDP